MIIMIDIMLVTETISHNCKVTNVTLTFSDGFDKNESCIVCQKQFIDYTDKYRTLCVQYSVVNTEKQFN